MRTKTTLVPDIKSKCCNYDVFLETQGVGYMSRIHKCGKCNKYCNINNNDNQLLKSIQYTKKHW